MGNRDDPLPQESFEGVDEDEWVSGIHGTHTLEMSEHNNQLICNARPKTNPV